MDAEQNRRQFQKMTETPVGRLVATLAVPTVVSMMVTSVYNMADTYFVSQIGTSASGAVGVVFPLMAVIQAIGFMLGMGAGSMISRLLGEKREKDASRVASTSFFSALVIGALLALFGIGFLDPLMRLIGSTETILPYARDYAAYILYGAPVMMASFVMNNILRSEGRASLAMVGIAAGGLLNVALDPLFIFVFDFGIAGAAIATLISQCVSFFILLSWFLAKKNTAALRPSCISRQLRTYGNILYTGLPSFCRQSLAAIATIALNWNARPYGDPAVAAMSIVGKIFLFVFSALLGFGQGYQPVVGYNYGAHRYRRVRRAFSFTFQVGFFLMLAFSVAGYLAAPWVMQCFLKDDPTVVRIGAYALRAQCLVMPLLPLNVVCNMTFQTIGKSGLATFLSAARQGIFFLPLIFLLPRFLGLQGVQITQALADLLTFFCCVPPAWLFLKRLPKEDEVPQG